MDKISTEHHNFPRHFGHTFKATVELHAIFHGLCLQYFSGTNPGGPSRKQLGHTLCRLDGWFNNLPDPLAHKMVALPNQVRVHLEYHATIVRLTEAAGELDSASAAPGDLSDQEISEIKSRAFTRMETLVYLYYLLHSYEPFNAQMLYFLSILGNAKLAILETGSPEDHLEEHRSTLILCVKGVHDQGKHICVPSVVFHVFLDRMQQRDKDLLLTYMKSEPGEDQESIAKYNQSQFPVPIIKINEDPRTTSVEQSHQTVRKSFLGVDECVESSSNPRIRMKNSSVH